MTEQKPTVQNLPARSTRAEPAARMGNLSAIIGRIVEAVEEETAAIRAGGSFDIKSSNVRKSRYLYELTRATRGVGEPELLAEHRDGIKMLRDKLATNAAVIQAHMGAVSEIATLMQNVIQRADADGTYSEGEFRVGRPLIKFIVAAVWICLATLGAVFYSFQTSSAKSDAAATPALLGGLDYIRTEVISVPVFSKATIDGYFLTRLVYTVDPAQMKKLSVPAQSLIVDEVYTYLYANPQIDFSKRENFNLDTFRTGVRDSVNKRVGEKLISEVIVEQIDFLSREETRDKSLRRREVTRPEATPAAAH